MARTHFDFSKYELSVEKNGNTTIHKFKVPNKTLTAVTFINSCGIMAVTGAFGNWIFSREFIPKKGFKVSDGYWCEKIEQSSFQTPYVFDKETVRQEIQEALQLDTRGITIRYINR